MMSDFLQQQRFTACGNIRFKGEPNTRSEDALTNFLKTVIVLKQGD